MVADRAIRATDAGDPLIRWVGYANIVTLVLLQKLAIVGSATQINIALPVMWISLLVLAVAGRLRIDTVILGLFALFLVVALPAVLFAETAHISRLSFLAAIAVYAPFVLRMKAHESDVRSILWVFQLALLGPAIMTFADLAVQLLGVSVMGQPRLSLEPFVPAKLLAQGYIYDQPLWFGSTLQKPNGFFLLEPSYLSQFMALGIIVELVYFRRPLFLLVYLATVAASFGGTGLMLLAAVLPFVLVKLSRGLIIAGIALLPVLAVTAVALNWTEYLERRIPEFTQPGSSAHSRFIEPFVRPARELERGDVQLFLIGRGPGTIETGDPAEQWNIFAKVTLEYGVPTLLAFVTFYTVALFRGSTSALVSYAGLIMAHFLSGAFIFPPVTFIAYYLSAGYGLIRSPAGTAADPAATGRGDGTGGESPDLAGAAS
ncbi:hypothetical protein [Zavarzinia sp. CC-PAN008]|uniref:hypothetical protein n=1 Tax=Zavarzinia sp. CC-PAN008 TaxID=3243332 RepID=UPI003F7490E3